MKIIFQITCLETLDKKKQQIKSIDCLCGWVYPEGGGGGGEGGENPKVNQTFQRRKQNKIDM